MRYLLDELHAYEHDYSGALRPLVSHKDNPSLAGDRALCAPATRKELASFQTSIIADVKDVRDALASVHADVHDGIAKLDAKLDAKVGRIEGILRDLTEAVTGARPSPVPTPSSSGHPSAYPTPAPSGT